MYVCIYLVHLYMYSPTINYIALKIVNILAMSSLIADAYVYLASQRANKRLV